MVNIIEHEFQMLDVEFVVARAMVILIQYRLQKGSADELFNSKVIQPSCQAHARQKLARSSHIPQYSMVLLEF